MVEARPILWDKTDGRTHTHRNETEKKNKSRREVFIGLREDV